METKKTKKIEKSATAKELTTPDNTTNPYSIASLTHFPDIKDNKWQDGIKRKLSPRAFIAILDEYSINSSTIAETARTLSDNGHIELTNYNKDYNWDYFNVYFNVLARENQGAGTLLAISKEQKVKVFTTQALDIYKDKIPDFCTQSGIMSSGKVSGAGVSYLKNKHSALLKHAEILERGTVSAKKQEIIRNSVVNNNITVNIKDLMNKPIQELADIDYTIDS